jgi:2-dehydro-3-deoxygluconokinase
MILTFGEIMGRLAPEGHLRFRQALPGRLELTWGGAEANVAVSIANFGGQSRFVTALPKNDLSEACVAQLRGLGVDVSNILRTARGRVGLYFVENGANQRPGNVIYDRGGSSISLTSPEEYDMAGALADVDWLHVSGITPALSQPAMLSTLEWVKKANTAGATVSCDLNFRKKLWRWDDTLTPNALAEKSMREILPFVDVVIANEKDAQDVLGIVAGKSDVESGKLDIEKYPDVAGRIASQFPNVGTIAVTLRQSISASHNNWGAMLYDVSAGKAHFAPMEGGTYRPYEIRDIVDRVGGGDSFAAGLIFALTTPELDAPTDAIRFAAAASCLAHSVKGDFNYSTRDEVERLMSGSAVGRIVR